MFQKVKAGVHVDSLLLRNDFKLCNPERPHLTLCLWTPQLIKLLICSRSTSSDHQRISSTWHSGNFEKGCLLSVSLKSTESTVHVEAR